MRSIPGRISLFALLLVCLLGAAVLAQADDESDDGEDYPSARLSDNELRKIGADGTSVLVVSILGIKKPVNGKTGPVMNVVVDEIVWLGGMRSFKVGDKVETRWPFEADEVPYSYCPRCEIRLLSARYCSDCGSSTLTLDDDPELAEKVKDKLENLESCAPPTGKWLIGIPSNEDEIKLYQPYTPAARQTLEKNLGINQPAEEMPDDYPGPYD